jgi:hypothetical protein
VVERINVARDPRQLPALWLVVAGLVVPGLGVPGLGVPGLEQGSGLAS